MTTLADRVADLGHRLAYAPDDVAARIESAVMLATETATRQRPRALPDAIPTPPPEVVAAAVRRTAARYVEVVSELVAGSLSTREVAAQLGISAQAVAKRRLAGRLVAFVHRGDWRYPAWQFDPRDPSRPLPGLLEAYRALPDDDPIGNAAWFTRPSRHLGDRTPLDLLRAGDADRVIDAAGYVTSR